MPKHKQNGNDFPDKIGINPIQGFRMPLPGETAHFVCKKCGHRFIGKLGGWGIPGWGTAPRCPECGSSKTSRDPMVIY
ncbi:hypothetical protein [Treponema sp.]|uniref:hypothetical protein n=1 Tax=Treponema sp. TaxID=166 RepID=UPI003FA285DB